MQLSLYRRLDLGCKSIWVLEPRKCVSPGNLSSLPINLRQVNYLKADLCFGMPGWKKGSIDKPLYHHDSLQPRAGSSFLQSIWPSEHAVFLHLCRYHFS